MRHSFYRRGQTTTANKTSGSCLWCHALLTFVRGIVDDGCCAPQHAIQHHKMMVAYHRTSDMAPAATGHEEKILP